MPQDRLDSVVMSPWKEFGQWRVQCSSDGFHESFYPQQRWTSGVRSGACDLCSCFRILNFIWYLLLQYFTIWWPWGSLRQSHISAIHSKTEWFDGETKDNEERQLFLIFLSFLAMPVWLLFVLLLKGRTVVVFAEGLLTLDLLPRLGDHGGQYGSLWWLFSHNHVSFWTDPENLLPN